jgi:hypothetical protein
MLAWLLNREPRWVCDIHAHIRAAEQRTKEYIMSAAQDTVDQLTAQVLKSKDEVLGKIADLEAQVAAGEAPDFTELKAAVQGVDDVVADVVVPAEPTA